MIGTLLNNRYRLDAQIGQGGMRVVYRAHDTLLDRDVAVKVLSETALDAEGRARLLREAQAAAQLNHPNVVSVHDAGRAAQIGGTPFIVMELVDGESLRERRPQGWRRPSRSPGRCALPSSTPTRTVSSTATSSREMS